MAIELSDSQRNAMQITERVASIFSLLGILFIFSTFMLARGFDKPINRLIYFASFSNLGMCIATLIAQDGPAHGQSSSLCQFQAWAIQMFLGVDVFWALCMSLNVYLALFQGWTAQRMRAQEWKYFIACYGAAFIPAVVYLFVETDKRGKVYGPALLWCWITTPWDFLRMATLYGIVWAALLFAFGIYCIAFAKVWRNRHELSGLFNPFNENPFAANVTTDIEIVHEEANITSPLSNQPEYFDKVTHGNGGTPDTPAVPSPHSPDKHDVYRVNIEAAQAERQPSRPELFRVRTFTREAALRETNADAWLYARVAFLFFIALLISWIPASINRLYSLVHPDRLIYGLNWLETLVLPLQGFWNCCVYIITSQTAVKNLFRSLLGMPEIPKKNLFSDGGGLDAATDDVPAKGVGMHMGKVATRFTNHARNDSRLDRYNARRPSEKSGRQRLGSDVSSIRHMAPVHAR